jgi:hypothetical protein
MPRLTVEFEEVLGDWGAQVGWVTVDVYGSIQGLRLHRLPVFQVNAGGVVGVVFGTPMLQGERPGSSYSGITFRTDEHRKRFLRDFDAALRKTNPELFLGELIP